MLNLERIRSLPDVEIALDYTNKDVVLYALSIGMGQAETELKYVFDEKLVCTPMFAMILAHHLPWLRQADTGIDVRKMLHGESSLIIHRPLPAVGRVNVKGRIAGVLDRGPGKSVSIFFEQRVLEPGTDSHLATVGGCFVFPGAGVVASATGTRGSSGTTKVPDGAADVETVDHIPTNAAQLYRLNGDRNTLHVDPEVARRAGFDSPILHGLCTFGYAGAAAIRALCDLDEQRVQQIQVRYSTPIYPGERLRTQFYRIGTDEYAFRCIAVERDVIVLDAGHLVLRSAK
ncbi:MaoC/PaaZ C-terminal domain-containing protein [Paraburkholderia phenoliruptrix]|uniref:MaoC/PaaZ C-terminal domain-containing protein n=1 Tax=Paraburkholderia phenoliruptrix TaxID=252970 RepID=UPI001C6ED52E|nr:MaoC/PaaZ C-terminal domain-containing protein [Paraburkholderia phenoliruptrix]MBW9107428.1 MaoC family dehydratase N-terminal domain-containing protein [Paraburkholderia phenoliruptrix]MBW9128150.1 MaoC family dehydratase N-terminal domain-containing protein [Paraburkholderia ginsengiterrae]